jgi:hypothetical protein
MGVDSAAMLVRYLIGLAGLAAVAPLEASAVRAVEMQALGLSLRNYGLFHPFL